MKKASICVKKYQNLFLVQCDDTTMEEERAHSASCEILMDALYDLEMSPSIDSFDANNAEDKTSALQLQRHREAGSIKRKRSANLRRNKRQMETSTMSPDESTTMSIGRPNNPPFFPNPNMTEYENQIRLQVSKVMTIICNNKKKFAN
jgi:hypothetical protein